MTKHEKRKRKRMNFLLITGLIVLIAGIIFMFVKEKPEKYVPDANATVSPTRETNGEGNPSHQDENGHRPDSMTPTASPTSTPTPVPPTPTPIPAPLDMEGLKQKLEDYIAEQPGKYGLYFINLISGDEFGINDRDEFIAASTTKLPMNLLLYKKIAAGDVDFDDMLTYREEDFEAGSGIIQKSDFETRYTVRETAKLSIIYSDNCGINMIIRLLGIDNIRQYMQDLGGTIYYGRRHRTCPYDLALYAQELYRFYQHTPEVAGYLIEDLQNTMWNDRINKLLPAEVKVSHKIGNFEEVYNDVGIIFASQPYVLAVMSDGIEHSAAADVIAQISKTIYDNLEIND